jgi:hypothetical protein
MNPDLFKAGTAGQLRKIGGEDTGYWAFIPNPLPPKLEIDFKFLQGLSEADRALGELAGLSRTMANPRLFVRPFYQSGGGTFVAH